MPRNQTWYHRIEFPDGFVTDGVHRPEFMLEFAGMPSVKGKNIVEVGCADHGITVELLLRGAAHVHSFDVAHYPERWHSLAQAFPVLEDADRHAFHTMNVEVGDWQQHVERAPDIISFTGVLYHLPDPYRALSNLRQIAKHGTESGDTVLVMETLGIKLDTDNGPKMPLAWFLTEGLLNGDPTNYWAFTQASLEELLTRSGWGNYEKVNERSIIGGPDHFNGCRFVYHATPT